MRKYKRVLTNSIISHRHYSLGSMTTLNKCNRSISHLSLLLLLRDNGRNKLLGPMVEVVVVMLFPGVLLLLLLLLVGLLLVFLVSVVCVGVLAP